MEWDMLGLKQGMAGLALVGAAASVPTGALAVASFSNQGIVEILAVGYGSAPGTIAGSSVATGYNEAVDTTFSNVSPFNPPQGGFSTNVQNSSPTVGSLIGPPGWTGPLNSGVAPQFPGADVLGSFVVEYDGIAPNIPGQISEGVGLIPPFTPFPFGGQPASMSFDISSPEFSPLSFQFIAQVTISAEALADLGESASTEGTFTLQVLNESGGEEFAQTLSAGTDSDGNDFGVLGVPSAIVAALNIPESSTWTFNVIYSASGSAEALPGQRPDVDVPVPAALPLLASALGGLIWMRRRKSA